MFQFFQMLLGYNFPWIGKECKKKKRKKKEDELDTSLNYFWHKNEKKISLNFIFCIRAPTFLTFMP